MAELVRSEIGRRSEVSVEVRFRQAIAISVNGLADDIKKGDADGATVNTFPSHETRAESSSVISQIRAKSEYS